MLHNMLIDARSNQDIVSQAVVEVSDRMLYDVKKNRVAVRNGPLDPKLV
jgi:DNA-directed RNA polymerase III subunit RPC1